MANSVISNLITTNITQNGGIDRITATEVRSVLNAINSFIQDDISYGTAIPFDRMVSRMAAHTVSSPITFTKNTTGAVPGGGTILDLAADGTNIPDFSAFEESTASSGWVNTAGVVNTCIFFYTGTKWFITIIQTAGGGAVALNTPGSFAAVPGASGEVVLTWTDTNSSPNEVGYKIYWNAINDFASAGVVTTTAANVTTYTKTGLGSGTWYFWIKAVGDGTTTTDSDTTSASSTAGTGTALNAPTGVTLGTATSTTQPLTWTDTNSSPNDSGYKVYYNTVNTFGSATLATTTAANATSYTVTGLSASTLYYYWVVAAGNGTTTSDSSPSTVQSGSTGAAGYDTDAVAVHTAIQATGVTLTTGQKDAINARILGLKAQSKWTDLVAYYGYVGGTAAAHAINWKSPGTYDITWNGTQTHSANGVLFDGSTGYGDTGINDNTVLNLNTVTIGAYSRTNSNVGFAIGTNGTNGLYLADRTSMITRLHDATDLTNAMTPTRTLMVTRQSTAPLSAQYRDGAQIGVNAVSAISKESFNLFVGANNNSGSAAGFSDKSYGSHFIFNVGFTSSEAATFATDETTFQTALSRNV